MQWPPKHWEPLFFLLNWLHFPCQCQHSAEVCAGGSIPLGIPRHSVNSPSAKGLLIPAYLFYQRRSKEPDPPHLPHRNKDSEAQWRCFCSRGASARPPLHQRVCWALHGCCSPVPGAGSDPSALQSTRGCSCSNDLGKVVCVVCVSKELHKLFARPRLKPKSQSHPPLPMVRDVQLRVYSPSWSVMLWEP